MNWGVCLGGLPSVEELRALGVGWVRVVALPGIAWHVDRYRQGGIQVAGVIARESGDPAQYTGIPWAAIVCGNEMDQWGESSWTMPPTEFYGLWYYCADLFPTVPRIIGGMASGIVDRAEPYLWVEGAAGFAVHPYAKTAEEARSLLRAYKLLSRESSPHVELPCWVTEFHRDAWEIPSFMAMLKEETHAAFWFAWDESVPGFGLIDANGVPKDKYHALRRELNMPTFVWGFKDLAERLGTDVVGEPLEDETYVDNINGERVAHIQATTKGLMYYTPRGNTAHFLPATLPLA